MATEFTKYKNKISKIGIKTHDIDLKRNSMNIFYMLRAFLQIFILILKVKPKILHLITLKPIILAGVIPIFYPINCLVLSVTGLGSMFIKKNFLYIFKLKIINLFYKVIFLNSNIKVILQNNNDLKYLNKYENLNIKKVKIIKGSGVDLNHFKFSKIPKKKLIILMASRIIEDKGVIEFLDAAKYLKKNKFKGNFFLLGDYDNDNPSVINQSFIKKFTKKKIIKHFKHQKNIFKFIKEASIIVLPSYREGFPKILMESSASGRPIITTNVPGCKDAVIKNKTGLLVSSKNYIQLAKAIKYLSEDRKKMVKFGLNGRKHALDNFDIKLIVSKHMSIYENL